MKIVFVGHPDGADVPIPGPLGGIRFVPYGEPVEFQKDHALGLLAQPSNWQKYQEGETVKEKPAEPGKE